MTEIEEEAVDIPEPERALPVPRADTSAVDPGGDLPPLPEREPALGEDPAYDPGGMGRQPDVIEDEEEHG